MKLSALAAVSLILLCAVRISTAQGAPLVIAFLGNAGPDTSYQTAISNYLLGLPSVTSMHNNMSTNASHY